MDEINENSIKKELLNLLDIETNKRAEDIDADKVSSIVRLMDVLNATGISNKGDSLKKFIYKFNKYHKTNLTDDIRSVRRKRKNAHMLTLTLLGILAPVFIVAGFAVGRSEKNSFSNRLEYSGKNIQNIMR